MQSILTKKKPIIRATFYLRQVNNLNSLPNDKFWGMTKFKAFADYNANVGKVMIFLIDRVSNIVGQGRKCWLPTFSPFPTLFSKGFFLGFLKVRIVW